MSALLVSFGALGSEARADGTTSSAGPLAFRGCESNERQEIARLVALDLGSSDAPSRPDPGSLNVTCQGGRFEIAVTRSASQTLTRAIDLRQLPARARPRIVAIAVVELFAADPAESAALPSVPPAAPVSPEASVPPATLVPPTCCRLHLAAAATGRTFLGGVPHLLGAGVRGDTGLFAFDALFEFGAPETTEGIVHIASLSSSATAGWSTTRGISTWRMGAGVRAGVARLSGEPSDPQRWSGQSPWRVWGGPKIEASLAFRLSSASVVQLTAESGYTLLSIYGLGTEGREVAMRGVFFGLQLGVGMGL